MNTLVHFASLDNLFIVIYNSKVVLTRHFKSVGKTPRLAI